MAESRFAQAAQAKLGKVESPFKAAMRKRVSKDVEAQLPGGQPEEQQQLALGQIAGSLVMETLGGEGGPTTEFISRAAMGQAPEGVTIEQAAGMSVADRARRGPTTQEAIVGTMASKVAAKVRGAGMLTSLASFEQDRGLEAFARGAQQTTVLGGDDVMTNLTSAVTQGPASMAEFMLLSRLPGAGPASFFLEGAGASAFQIEEAAKAGEMPYSRARQYLGAAVGGGIESASEMIGGKIAAGFARSTAAEFLSRGVGKTAAARAVKGFVGGAAAEGFIEEGPVSLATNYIRKPISGEKVKPLPEALSDALYDSLYGSVGGAGAQVIAVPIGMAQESAVRKRLSDQLAKSQTEYSDPKYWERVAPTVVGSLQGMNEAERMAEMQASEEAAVQARGDIAVARQKAASLVQKQADIAKRLATAKRKKDDAAVQALEQEMNTAVTEIDQHQKDMAVLAADQIAADTRLATVTAYIAQRRPQRRMTMDEVMNVEQVTAANPTTEADVAAMKQLSSMGYDVVFYDDANADRQAFFNPATPNTLYIRAGNDAKTLGEVIGIGFEEALHSIQLTDGKLWQAMRNAFDERSVLESAINYFGPQVTAEDRVAVASAVAALNGDRSGNVEHIMRRWGTALTDAEGTANNLRDGITTLFRTGRAPGLLGRVLARTGLRGRQAATALKVYNMMLARERRGAAPTELAGRVREAQAGIAAFERVSAEAQRRAAPAPSGAAAAAAAAPTAPPAPPAPAPVPPAAVPAAAPAAAPAVGESGMLPADAAAAQTENFKAMVNLAVNNIRASEKGFAKGKRLYPIMEAMERDPATLSDEDREIGRRLQQEMYTEFGPEFRSMWARRRVATDQDRATWKKWLRWNPVTTAKGGMVGVPQWVKTRGDIKSLRRMLRRFVDEGKSGRYWYEDSVDEIMEIVNGDPVDAEKFVQLLAIYSPNTNVWVNTINAVRAYSQWKSGVPESAWSHVSSELIDNKAKALLYRNQNWDGRKTNSFYANLMYGLVMKHPDKFATFADEARATIDVWMARAFGYEGESFTDDKGRGGYTFAENEIRRITAELNTKLGPEDDIWTPHQVQAAIWTAMKTRYEQSDVKERTNARSLADGLITYKDGQAVYPTDAAGKKRHGANWREEAMKPGSLLITQRAEELGRSFADDLRRMTQITTWEAVPDPVLNKPITSAPIRTQSLFTSMAAGIIFDEQTGMDTLAMKIGVPIAFSRRGMGGWQGTVAPNILSHMIPATKVGEEVFTNEFADLYTRAIQYIFYQRAVPWFRPENAPLVSQAAQNDLKFRVVSTDSEGNARAIASFATQAEAQAEAQRRQQVKDDLVSRMRSAEKQNRERRTYSISGGKFARAAIVRFNNSKFADGLNSFLVELNKFLPGAGLTRISSNEVLVANYRGDNGVPMMTDDESFIAGLTRMGSTSGTSLDISSIRKLWVESKYGDEHDWSADPTGQSLLNRGSLAKRPDLHPWLRDRRNEFDALLEQFSGDGAEYQQALADLSARQFGRDRSLAARRGATVDASRIRAGSLGIVREYGSGIRGASRFIGVHFSPESRARLSSSAYGKGMRGAEMARIASGSDERLWQRVYFYVDSGNGIVPEASVGDQIHGVILNNVYDAKADPLGIVRRFRYDANGMEGAIIDAGFDGVFIPKSITERGVTMGAIVMLGKRTIPVEQKGSYNENVLRQMEIIESGGALSARARATDADYLAAVERGDMETAQRMVDEAARASGLTEIVWRGDRNAARISEYRRGARREPGIFTTADRQVADKYADTSPFRGDGKARRFYVGGRTLDLTQPTSEAIAWIRKWAKDGEWDFIDRRTGESMSPEDAVMSGLLYDWEGTMTGRRWKDIQSAAAEDGYDIVKLVDEDKDAVDGTFVSTVVLNENKIKLADPVTRDDAGNIIPLSQRFQTTESDIRMARRRTPKVEIADAGKRLTAARVALDVARKGGDPVKIAEARKEFKSALRGLRSVGRIDRASLAFAIGRRAGQVAGVMKGRKMAAKEIRDVERAKAIASREELRSKFKIRMARFQERLDREVATNDALRTRMDRARRLAELRRDEAAERAERKALKAWFAGQAKGSAAGWAQAKQEMVEIRKQAAEIISSLPRSMRGKYIDAMASMRTPSGVAVVARRVMQDLYRAEAIETVSDINRLRKRVKKIGLRSETRASIKAQLDAAFGLLATGRKRLLPFTDSIDLRNRVISARQALANAQDAFDLEREEYRAGRDGRAEEVAADSAVLGATINTLEALPAQPTASQAPQRGVVRQLLTEFLNMDAYTLMQRLEGGESGVFGKMWNQLKAGKNSMTAARRDIDSVIDAALRRAGYAGYDGYAARAAGLYGDTSAETVTVRMGGVDRLIPVDMMLNIAALDEDTVALLTDANDPESRGSPIVFSTYRKGDPIILTQQEHAAIVAALTPQQRVLIEDMKSVLEEKIRPMAFEIYFQINGRQPDMVPGYFPRQRLGDEIGDANIDVNMDPTQVVSTMLSNAGFLKERVAARSTLVISGMMRTMDSHIDESMRLIHLSLPLRYAMTVLRSTPVRTSMERVLGDGANDAVRKLVLNGVGLSGRPTNDLIEKLNSNVSGALISLNPKTWVRQLGGAFRLSSEMPAAALAEGTARSLAMTLQQRKDRIAYIEGLSPYLYDRHRRSQIGIFANVIGDPRTGTEQWANAMQATGRSLATLGQSAAAGDFMRAAQALRDGSMSVGKIARSADGVIRSVDRQIMLVAFEGFRSDLKRRNPGMADADIDRMAAQMSEDAFRRTQNVSDSLDDTLYAATNKFNKGIGRVLFPFSSDPLKAHNQLRRAIMSRDPVQVGRTTAGIAGNMALAAAVNPLWALAGLAVANLFGGDEEDEEIIRRMLLEREMKYSASALAADAVSAVAGYSGILGSGLVEAAMSSPEMADDVMEPLAIRMIGEGAKQAAAWRYGEVTGTALQLAGIPVVSPIRTITRTAEQVRPPASRLLTEYRKREREGTLTPTQRRRMAELERLERIRKATATTP